MIIEFIVLREKFEPRPVAGVENWQVVVHQELVGIYKDITASKAALDWSRAEPDDLVSSLLPYLVPHEGIPIA